jgi:hypothetical protein
MAALIPGPFAQLHSQVGIGANLPFTPSLKFSYLSSSLKLDIALNPVSCYCLNEKT